MDQARAPETGCCPRFDPAPWQDKEIVMKDRLFLKDRVASFLRIPLNFGQVMVRSMKRSEAAGAMTSENLCLTDENSLWGADVYIAVSKEVPGAKMARISGTFLTKVFEGGYKEMGSWIKEMKAYVAAKGRTSKRLLFYYTTCPKCAKQYGHNYVVILAEV